MSTTSEAHPLPVNVPRGLERGLVEDFLPNLSSAAALSRSREWTVAREVSLQRLIPDLVAVGRVSSLPRLEKLSSVQADVLSFLAEHSNAASIGELSEGLFLRRHVAESTLATLASRGLIRKHSDGTFSSSVVAAVSAAEVVAVEAKLSRWKDALRQAIEYTEFANRVFVLLHTLTAPDRPAALEQFSDWGVGLIVRDGRGFRRLLSARQHYSMSPRRYLAIARAL